MLQVVSEPVQVPGLKAPRYVASCSYCGKKVLGLTKAQISRRQSCGCRGRYKKEWAVWNQLINHDLITNPNWATFDGFLKAVGPIPKQFTSVYLSKEGLWLPYYGLLKVIHYGPETCQVRCACGKVQTVGTKSLQSGKKRDCGPECRTRR